MTLFFDLLYILAMTFLLPYLFFRILENPHFFQEKILPRLKYPPYRFSKKPSLWIHSVSVGEVLAVESFVKALEKALPHYEVVLSTTTPTGFSVAKKVFPRHLVFYFPLDASWFILRTFRFLRPSMILLVELEVWPNLIYLAHQHSIPVVIINGRITERSFRNYSFFLPLFRRVFSKVSFCFAQNEEYARRFAALGISPERILVTGNLKFDNVFSGDEKALEREMRRELGLLEKEPVLVAGSTHEGEEEVLLKVFQNLRRCFPDLRLILAPRHPRRASEILRYLQSKGEKVLLRSLQKEAKLAPQEKMIILVDTIGELSRIYAVASLVFVGGSLVPRGGHNVLEPAALGKAVLVGPYTYNFAKIVEYLASQEAICVVKTEKEMEEKMRELLKDEKKREKLAKRAKEAIRKSSGAVQATVEKICQFVGELQKQSKGELP